MPRVEIKLRYLNCIYNKKFYNAIISRSNFDDNIELHYLDFILYKYNHTLSIYLYNDNARRYSMTTTTSYNDINTINELRLYLRHNYYKNAYNEIKNIFLYDNNFISSVDSSSFNLLFIYN